MRCLAIVAASLAASRVAGHPLCWDDTPPDLDQDVGFCPEQQAGTCCTDLDEVDLEAAFTAAGDISTDCAIYLKEVSRLRRPFYIFIFSAAAGVDYVD